MSRLTNEQRKTFLEDAYPIVDDLCQEGIFEFEEVMVLRVMEYIEDADTLVRRGEVASSVEEELLIAGFLCGVTGCTFGSALAAAGVLADCWADTKWPGR